MKLRASMAATMGVIMEVGDTVVTDTEDTRGTARTTGGEAIRACGIETLKTPAKI